MAKDPGLSFKTEQDFQKSMGTTMNPKAFQQVVQQLRTNNLSAKSISADNISAKTLAEPVIKDSKEIKSKQEELKSTETLTETNKKLTTNIEKLTKSISSSILGKANRAEEIAKKQKLDYRGVGQQFKEKIMGRGGDKWDRESLKYKFGSVRGIMGTLGLRGLPGADNAMAKREEIKQTATRMTEANAGMQNLKQFAVYEDEVDPVTGKKIVDKKASQKNVEKYYEKRGVKVQAAKANLQAEQYNRDKFREAGISDEEFNRTTGGKIQNKKLAEAGQAVIDIDPTLQGEKKGAIQFAGPDDLNVSEEESSQLAAIESVSGPTEELINITKIENERKAKADSELLVAIQNMQAAEGGGALSGLANAASSIGGKKAGVGMLAKAGTFLAGNAGAITGGASILAGGVAAYKGYSDYNEADEQVKSGAITEDEGDIKKTGAAGTGIGGVGGALVGGKAGAAIGTLIFPGVGTAIGGALGAGIGAFAGSKAGKGIGEWGSKTYKSLTGNKTESSSSISGKVVQGKAEGSITLNGQTLNPGDPGYDEAAKQLVNTVADDDYDEEGAVTDTQAMKSKYYKPKSGSLISKDIAIDKAKMQIYADRQNAAKVAAQSSDNAIAKTPSNAAPSNTIVNAPTTVSKQTQNTAVNVPVRDQDHSIRKYYNSRFAT
jgi:hypothetical protein